MALTLKQGLQGAVRQALRPRVGDPESVECQVLSSNSYSCYQGYSCVRKPAVARKKNFQKGSLALDLFAGH